MVATAAPRVTVPYAGIATRGIALTVDAALANGLYIVGAALLGLVASLVGDLHPRWLVALLAATGWAIVVGGYFVLFWTTTGQTPGSRVMSIEVRGAHGERLSVRRAFVRVLLLPLSVIPFGAGLWLILVDRRRRALHDQIARTVVVYVAKVPRERAPLGAKAGGLPPSGARERRPVYAPPDAQDVSTSPPPSSATRAPKRISAG